MLKSEVLTFLKDVNKIYPSWRIEDYQGTVDMWHRYLEKEDKEHVYKALDEYVTVERNKFAPSVSDIINLAKRYKPDPRFEGIEYWENRIKGIYPYAWDFVAFREWYTTDREAQRFYNYLKDGIGKAERGEIPETALNDFADVLKIYEVKKCLVMKKD